MSEILLFTGPHGAGKDTLEHTFRSRNLNVERVVRHITRPKSNNEINGLDYHFVSRNNFEDLIQAEEFIEYAEYPDCLSGTTKAALQAATENAEYGSIVLNFEDAERAIPKIGALALRHTPFFVSPVSRDEIENSGEAYLDELERRMRDRGRQGDYIDNKLAKAEIYRQQYLQNHDRYLYVENKRDGIQEAVTMVEEAILERGH